MTARLARRTAGALILIAAAATLTGCNGAVGAKLTFDDTEKVKVTEIVVAGGAGDIRVTTSAITETRIKRVVRGGGDPGPSYRLAGTVLSVDTTCGSDCWSSYEIEAPTGVTVRGGLNSGNLGLLDVASADVSVKSGDIHIERATGPVKATATSGNIDVAGSTGPVTLGATSGNISALDLTGGNAVKAEVSSGNIDLLLQQSADVSARASSGNIDVAVPAGAYRIDERVGSGTFESDFTADPKGTQLLSVRTSSGNVTIRSS
ncbi:DUF4097 family beta strand repeat-containing protein [Actinoplanes sp. NPDC051859]|uniref:DUF4097 family beta strand repeat-containing protein n=1 Tax=Actinoplanes sp. NPDC051859 TaxID=3363909 RepID=UPI0037B7F098